MRDRFPLLLAAGLLLAALLGGALLRGARRGDFADTLSTFRSREGGARALYLLAESRGLRVERRMSDLREFAGDESLVLLAIDFADAEDKTPEETELVDAPDAGTSSDDVPRPGLNTVLAGELAESERTLLLAHLEAGGRLLYAPWGAKENGLLEKLGVELRKADPQLGLRTLVPPQVTPWTRGVQQVEAPVQSFLRLPPDAIPLLVDFRLGAPVAAWIPRGDGGVFILSAPQALDNEHLGLADNARLALQLLATLGEDGRPIHFDEYHHGFRSERSIVDFGSRHGLHWALLQLLLGLVLWALSLRRFGPPRPPDEEARHTRLELLAASARLYREGQHHRWSAQLLARWLTQTHAPLAGVRARAPKDEVLAGLRARGLEELVGPLQGVWNLADTASHPRDVLATARATALAHRQVLARRRTPTANRSKEEEAA